ncbi:Kruppel-like factor 18 [Grammomys surdaster]|uniref:Kruppel-like factor 18 n=1 Tax=Grammomys surdaster TaxID=491861 RepID=UPI00109F04A4|nr:Kruppel-like factor 18 [Grammomys surdaster]
MDMGENTGASQPRLCNTQPSPVESSQVVSGQSSEMPTWKQTVMTSASCSTEETACTQNSTAHPGKAIEFHFGEPSETSSLNQQVAFAEQKNIPAGPQLMQLNSNPMTCLFHPQMTAVLDTEDTFYNDGYCLRTLSPDKTVLIHNTGMCESQSTTSHNHQIALSGSHVGHDPKMDHFLASANDQTLSGDLQMTFNDDQTSYYSQLTTRNGGHLTLYGNQMTAPSYSQALHPNEILTSLSEQNPLGDSQRNLVADNRSYGDQMITPNGYQVFYEPQKRDNCDQIKHHYQMTSFGGQKVCKGQESLFSGEYSLSGYQTSGYRCDQNLIENHQVTSLIDGQPLYDFQMPIFGFDTILHGTQTTFNAEDSLDFHSEKSFSSEEMFYFSQMRASLDQNVYPSQNGTPNIDESLDSQVTLLSNQAPYVSESSYPSSSPVIKRQPQESSSPSGLIQEQHPEMNLDLKTQSHAFKKTPYPLKRYNCTYQDCNKSYTKSHHLKNHMKKHTGERDYACDETGCPWSFFRLEDLKRHKIKHSGVRPHTCPECNKSYSRLNYLNQHLKSHT